MSQNASRRDFLIATGAGMALSALPAALAQAAQTPAGTVRTRRNVTEAASQADLEALRSGVGEMKKLIDTQPTDPRGWVLQSFIHGDCTQFTFCQHGNWYFAPWHRVYLYYFEKLIAHYSGKADFALPYWDWSNTHGVPASFYGDGNALNDTISISGQCSGAPSAGRGRTVDDAFTPAELNTYVGTEVVSRIVSNPDYASFGGAQNGGGELEQTPHNFVHRWVGGVKQSNMVQTFSPLDPIFWLHHCNVDRLYSNWLSRPGHLPPVLMPAWADKSFNDFFDVDGKPAGEQWTCGKTVDSKVLGYAYDTDQRLTLLATEKARARAVPKVIAKALSARPTVKDGALTFETQLPEQGQDRRLLSTAALMPRRYAVRLSIDGIKTPEQQNTAVHVFLGAHIAVDTPTAAPGYVGSITFFNAPGASKHHGADGVTILNATDAFQALYGDFGLPDGQPLTVSLVTRPLYDGVTQFGSVEEIAPQQTRIEILELDE